jgi:hypothetical protein
MPLATVKSRLFRAKTLLKERLTAPLATHDTRVGTALIENEEAIHTSESFPSQGRGQDNIPDTQETDNLSQHQQMWLAQQRSWIEQRLGWLTQQGDKLTQQEAWLIQQEAWLDQQHTALVQQYSELVQQHQWVQQLT